MSRYVEFAKPNYRCFSIEIARVLLAAASEVDVVCKRLCVRAKATSTASNINSYRRELTHAYPGITKAKVCIPRFDLTLHPWKEWSKPSGNPLWWRAYNEVKHQRDARFKEANLKNALNAVAGLFVLVLYLLQDRARLGELVPDPQLLRPARSHFLGVTVGSPDGGIAYRLP